MATLVEIRGLNASSASSGSGFTQNRGFRIKGQTKATLTTSLTGANNDIVFTAKDFGAAGNDITIAYVDPAANSQSLGVVVTGTDIVVNLATDGAGAITSTADLIKTAIAAEQDADDLVDVADASGNDGSGVVTAMAETNLAGGEGELSGVSVSTAVTVDVDDPAVRKVLREHAGRWIEDLQGDGTAVLRGLRSSEAAAGPSQSRGFRILPDGGGTEVRVNQGAATTVDLTDGPTRRRLRHMWKDYVPAAAGSALITIRGLDRSEAHTQSGAATSGLVSRGMTIRDAAGTAQKLSNAANIQVDLGDSYIRRILRRNRDKFVVISAP